MQGPRPTGLAQQKSVRPRLCMGWRGQAAGAVWLRPTPLTACLLRLPLLAFGPSRCPSLLRSRPSLKFCTPQPPTPVCSTWNGSHLTSGHTHSLPSALPLSQATGTTGSSPKSSPSPSAFPPCTPCWCPRTLYPHLPHHLSTHNSPLAPSPVCSQRSLPSPLSPSPLGL